MSLGSRTLGLNMSRFAIYMKGKLIGHSNLEYGDPPMGVAHGRFIPLPEYQDVQALVVKSYGDQAHLEFVIYSDHSIPIPCIAVGIKDMSAELGLEEGLYIDVLGIPYPEYAAIFPNHVAHYESQF
jgi:hypothetical protein